jgi:hypothetical protein
MEKMGWEKGTGANQEGMVDHITLKQRHLVAHHEQDDFQSVLAALIVEHGEAGKNMDEDEKKATLSEISKKSK